MQIYGQIYKLVAECFKDVKSGLTFLIAIRETVVWIINRANKNNYHVNWECYRDNLHKYTQLNENMLKKKYSIWTAYRVFESWTLTFQKNCVICLIENPLKTMENDLYFILKLN